MNYPPEQGIVERIRRETQDRWDDSQINFTILGDGGEVTGLLGIFKDCLTKKDWISLYRAQKRRIYAAAGKDVKSDLEVLQNLEHRLFDTTKYFGAAPYMTIQTYGYGDYGTLHLFEVSLETPGQASSIRSVAIAKGVPRAILRRIGGNNQVELARRGSRIRCVRNDSKSSVTRVQAETHSQLWNSIGEGWRRALGVGWHGEHDGLLATIPQMMGLLHLKSSSLHNIKSTSFELFAKPLAFDRVDEDAGRLPYLDVGRGLKIVSDPKGDGHFGSEVNVVVLFPSDSAWTREILLWA